MSETAEEQQQQQQKQKQKQMQRPNDADAEEEEETCAVRLKWLTETMAQRDRLEDENMRLGDRLGALQIRLRFQEEQNEMLRETNASLQHKLRHTGRSLRRESGRLKRSMHAGEVSPAQAVVRISLCLCFFVFAARLYRRSPCAYTDDDACASVIRWLSRCAAWRC
jgi:hypothetical protein